MNFAVISLIVLVVVVAIGFIKKVNLGFLPWALPLSSAPSVV